MFLIPAAGYIGVCFASPAAWILADLFLIPAYIYVMKVLNRQKEGANPKTA